MGFYVTKIFLFLLFSQLYFHTLGSSIYLLRGQEDTPDPNIQDVKSADRVQSGPQNMNGYLSQETIEVLKRFARETSRYGNVIEGSNEPNEVDGGTAKLFANDKDGAAQFGEFGRRRRDGKEEDFQDGRLKQNESEEEQENDDLQSKPEVGLEQGVQEAQRNNENSKGRGLVMAIQIYLGFSVETRPAPEPYPEQPLLPQALAL